MLRVKGSLLPVYVLLVVVLEGSVRKWLSPDLTLPIVAFRDALVMAFVWRQLSKEGFSSSLLYEIGLIWSAICLVWILVQAAFGLHTLVSIYIAARFWILYPLFGFVLAGWSERVGISAFESAAKVLFYLSVPLMVWQFSLPPESVLNAQLDTEVSEIFRVAGDTVRPSGFFTFTLGACCFISLVAPQVISGGLGFSWKKDVSRGFSVVGLIGLITITLVSGSRALLFHVSILLFVVIVVSFFSSGLRRVIVPGLGISAVGLLLLSLFTNLPSGALSNFEQRFIEASDVEDLSGRLLEVWTGETGIWSSASLLGTGISSGSNMSNVARSGQRGFTSAETEPGRIVLEGGALGVIFFSLKWAMSFWGTYLAARLAVRSLDVVPLIFMITLCIGINTWPLSGQLSVNALGWLLFGWSFCVLRMSLSRNNE